MQRIRLEVLPPEVIDAPLWVSWHYGPRKGDKHPGFFEKWAAETLDPVAHVLDRIRRENRPELGVARRFDGDHVALDLDRAVEVPRDLSTLAEWARPIVEHVIGRCYMEWSQSGRGMHILLRDVADAPKDWQGKRPHAGYFDWITNRNLCHITTDTEGLPPSRDMVPAAEMVWILEAIMAAYPVEGQTKGGATPPPPAPVARPTAVTAPVSDVRRSAYADQVLRDIAAEMASTGEGGRNNALNERAFRVGQLVADGIITDTDGALDVLRAAAERAGLDAREIDRTIRSGFEAGQGAPRGPLPDRPMPPRPVVVRDDGGAVVPATLDAGGQVARLRVPPAIRVRGMAFDDPELAAQSQIQWLITKWVGVNMISVLTGIGGSGKSTLALTMALLATRSATVAWIPAEGAQEWPSRARVQAEYLRRQGVTGIDPGKVLIYNPRMGADGQYENPGLNLIDAVSRRAYTDALRADGVRFVIFDAWAGHLALAGLDENDASQSGQALVGVNEMITELGAAALIITHSGKGSNGIRGSARVRDEARVVVEATLTGETLKLRCDKANNGKPFDTLLLTMATWSTTHNGETLEAPVLRHYDRPVTKGAASGDEIELLRRLTWADYEDGATTAELLGTYEPRIAPTTLNDMCKRSTDRGHLKAIRHGEAGHRGRSNGVVWKITPKGRDAIEQAEDMGGVAAVASSPAILPGNPALFVVQPLAPLLPAIAAQEASYDGLVELAANPRGTHGEPTEKHTGKHTGNPRQTHGELTANSRGTHGETHGDAGQVLRIAMPNDDTNTRGTHGEPTDFHAKHTGGGGSFEPPTPWVRGFVAGDSLPDAAKGPTMPAGAEAEGPAADAAEGEEAMSTTVTSRPPQYAIDAWRADPDRWWARYAPDDARRDIVTIRRGEADAGAVYLVLNNTALGVLPGTCLEGYTTEAGARAAAKAQGVEPAARVSPVALPVAEWYAPTEGDRR